MPVQPSIVLTDLTFHWPDGTLVLNRLSGRFGPGRTGLVGPNGVGKSTLLRLIAHELSPTSGKIETTGRVDYLPQDVSLQVDARVSDLLGIAPIVDAVSAVARGDHDPELFDRIGTDWDIEHRAAAALTRVGLPNDLDRPVGTLSGGETTLVAVLGVQLRNAPIAILDEPTNNLDRQSRAKLHGLVRRWRGTLVLASHDTELLQLTDATTELREGAITTVGGPYNVWRETIDQRQIAAEQAVRTARQSLRTEQRQRVQAEQQIAHSSRQGRRDWARSRYVKAAINNRRNSAEKSAGSRRDTLDDRVAEAREALEVASQGVRADERIRVDLPDPGVPSKRRLAVLSGSDGRDFVVAGPQRVALTGPNGVGKTTLVSQLFGSRRVLNARAVAMTDAIACLPQRLDIGATTDTVLDTMRRAAPQTSDVELRNRLARFLLRRDAVHQMVSTLSGGERFRVALAQLLLADPPPELLVLDEPTNNLDLDSVDQLVDALGAYRGGIIVVSHDYALLERLDLNLWLELGRDGCLREREV